MWHDNWFTYHGIPWKQLYCTLYLAYSELIRLREVSVRLFSGFSLSLSLSVCALDSLPVSLSCSVCCSLVISGIFHWGQLMAVNNTSPGIMWGWPFHVKTTHTPLQPPHPLHHPTPHPEHLLQTHCPFSHPFIRLSVSLPAVVRPTDTNGNLFYLLISVVGNHLSLVCVCACVFVCAHPFQCLCLWFVTRAMW